MKILSDVLASFSISIFRDGKIQLKKDQSVMSPFSVPSTVSLGTTRSSVL
jgi:hypothetical protein